MIYVTWGLLSYGDITTVIQRTMPIIRSTFPMNPEVPVALGLSLSSRANSKQVNYANVFQYEDLNTDFLHFLIM